MSYLLYDYLAANGDNEFYAWVVNIEVTQRAKLNQKLDALKLHGEELFPEVLTNSGVPGILKLRVRGNVQLRPLLCRGPINVRSEFTLLMGATEKGDRWKPKDAPKMALDRKHWVIKDPDGRRIEHERVE